MSKSDNFQSKNQVSGRNWSNYYKAVANRPPRETLITALTNFEIETPEAKSRIAIDLGCGEGRDTVELLRRGWQVIAIDAEKEAISQLLKRPHINTNLLETHIAQFENIPTLESANLVNASFSLPFCAPESFPDLWNKIYSCLLPGSRFCGHLFGSRDSWANDSTMNHHTRSELEALLRFFEVEFLREEEHLGKTALGKEKYWHIFHIVARKK
ncbi:MAG: class I SAM-dependent methyltransferase [Cyanobacteria bacterium P01_D01_bin.50]